MSDDRILRFLTGLTILLFVSTMVLPRGRGRYPGARWAQGGAVAAFSAAVLYVLWLTVVWALRQR